MMYPYFFTTLIQVGRSAIHALDILSLTFNLLNGLRSELYKNFKNHEVFLKPIFFDLEII